MNTFQELVDSRKAWIEGVLRSWCLAASRAELLKAEAEWVDLAGKVDPDFTLWLWAWERFPVLYVEGLKGLDETFPVSIKLRDGSIVTGFPDSRSSRRGELHLLMDGGESSGPIKIDEIQSVQRSPG